MKCRITFEVHDEADADTDGAARAVARDLMAQVQIAYHGHRLTPRLVEISRESPYFSPVNLDELEGRSGDGVQVPF